MLKKILDRFQNNILKILQFAVIITNPITIICGFAALDKDFIGYLHLVKPDLY